MSRGKDYAEKCSLSLGDKIYFAPNIPPQKLRNALSRYGFGIDADEVVVLIDDTVFGSAREGVIITRDSFQFKEIFNPPDSRRLSEDDELSVEKGFGNRVVKLNGRKIMSLTQADYDDLDCLFEWVNELYHGELDETEAEAEADEEEDNEEEASSAITSGTKNCPFCGETIKAVAIKCRFCGEMLEEEATLKKTNTPKKISNISVDESDNIAADMRDEIQNVISTLQNSDSAIDKFIGKCFKSVNAAKIPAVIIAHTNNDIPINDVVNSLLDNLCIALKRCKEQKKPIFGNQILGLYFGTLCALHMGQGCYDIRCAKAFALSAYTDSPLAAHWQKVFLPNYSEYGFLQGKDIEGFTKRMERYLDDLKNIQEKTENIKNEDFCLWMTDEADECFSEYLAKKQKMMMEKSNDFWEECIAGLIQKMKRGNKIDQTIGTWFESINRGDLPADALDFYKLDADVRKVFMKRLLAILDNTIKRSVEHGWKLQKNAAVGLIVSTYFALVFIPLLGRHPMAAKMFAIMTYIGTPLQNRIKDLIPELMPDEYDAFEQQRHNYFNHLLIDYDHDVESCQRDIPYWIMSEEDETFSQFAKKSARKISGMVDELISLHEKGKEQEQ